MDVCPLDMLLWRLQDDWNFPSILLFFYYRRILILNLPVQKDGEPQRREPFLQHMSFMQSKVYKGYPLGFWDLAFHWDEIRCSKNLKRAELQLCKMLLINKEASNPGAVFLDQALFLVLRGVLHIEIRLISDQEFTIDEMGGNYNTEWFFLTNTVQTNILPGIFSMFLRFIIPINTFAECGICYYDKGKHLKSSCVRLFIRVKPLSYKHIESCNDIYKVHSTKGSSYRLCK